MGEEVKMTEYDNCNGGGADDNGGEDDRVFEWEAGLPKLDDLTPLSQPLISPELASAFSISPEPSKTLLDVMRASQNTLASLRGNSAQSQGFSSNNNNNNNNFKSFAENCQAAATAVAVVEQEEEEEESDRSDSRKLRKTVAVVDSSAEEADSALRTEASADDPSARTLKRPRLVWTPQLHKRFVDVVAHLGIKNAVPKTIMQLMNVEGLTRENVASHLQKYRLYLKRMQGLSSEGPSSSDQLFASTPVPQSLHETGANGNGHVHGHGHGHGHGHMPMPIPMPYGAAPPPPPPPPPMMHMPVYGMAHGHGHMGMQMGGQGGFEGNPYMMQQRDWPGNRFGSVVPYPHAAAPNDK